MEEQPTISTLVLAILGLLAKRPMSGYDLRKVFATTAMGNFSSSPGAIYPALKRCQRAGWLQGEVENVGSLRPRQVFSLTDQGRQALEAHLRQPVTREDMTRRLGELMLRFAFCGDILGPEPTRQFLREYLREAEAYLEVLREQLASIGELLSPCGRFAMEHGIEGYEMEVRWARRVLEEL